jgi:flagellar basal-body rod protein FlgB
MIDGLFAQPNYVGTKRMLDATVMRHEAIASNLANIETPRYRRVDVAPAFASELQQAVRAGDSTTLQSLRPSVGVDPKATSATKDGNTVQLESEMFQLSQNHLAHSLETHLVTGTLMKLRAAIGGRAA